MRNTLIAITALAVAGFAGAAGAQVSTVKSGTIVTDETWGGGATPCPILLDGPVVVGDGVDESPPVAGSWRTKVELTILPGCVIRGQGRSGAGQAGAPGSLIVSRTGRVVAIGDPQNPIIFTTAALDANPADGVPDRTGGFLDQATGATPIASFFDDDPANNPKAPLDAAGQSNVQLWGGIVILGKAPVNVGNGTQCPAGDGSVEGECTVEGLELPGQVTTAQATYGGGAFPQPHDSSGSFRYVSVRHGGDEIGTANEINGVTLAGVGDGTEFGFVEVYANFDDGFEFFGGTVNTDHLVVTLAGDDQLDSDQGYTGVNQFAFLVMSWFGEVGGGNFGSSSSDNMMELDGDDFNEAEFGATINCCPTSSAHFYNITGIGSDQVASPDFTPGAGDDDGATDNQGPLMRNGFGGAILNSIFTLTDGPGLAVDENTNDGCPGLSTAEQITDCKTEVLATTFHTVGALVGTGCGGGGCSTAALTCGDDDERTACPGPGCNVVNPAAGFSINNSDTSFDPQGNANGDLDATLKAAPIDPRTSGFTGTIGGVTPATGALLDRTATYRGAFRSSLTTLWVDDWTVLSIAGLIE